MEDGCILDINITRGVDPINHALFTNDSLLLGGASLKISRAFNDILQKKNLISRALINNKKNCSLWLECRAFCHSLNIKLFWLPCI